MIVSGTYSSGVTKSRYLMTWILNTPVPKAPHSRSQMGMYISVPRAVVMSPKSMMCFQPNQVVSKSATWALASTSLPLTKMWWSPSASWQ